MPRDRPEVHWRNTGRRGAMQWHEKAPAGVIRRGLSGVNRDEGLHGSGGVPAERSARSTPGSKSRCGGRETGTPPDQGVSVISRRAEAVPPEPNLPTQTS